MLMEKHNSLKLFILLAFVVLACIGQGSQASADVPNITVNMEANISVVCLPDYIEVTLLKANFPGIVVNDSVLHLNDMSCGAGYKDDDMVKFTFGLESCGNMMSSNGDKIYYMNNVYLAADPPTENSDITRYHTEVIPFSCGYDKKATISKISYNPRSTLVISDAEGFGNFTYEMTMYTDETNQDEVTEFPFEVGLGLPMYLGFSVKSGDSMLDVFPDVCKATAGSGFDSTPDHLIMENACPRDKTLKYDYEQSAKHYFSVSSFRFKQGYEDVYIHCKLTACRRADGNSRCAKGCQESRRRRSLEQSNDMSATLRIGPLSLTQKNQRDVALDEKSDVAAESSSSSMVMVVGVLVGVLGTVAIALVVAVVIISRRRKYATVDKGDPLVVTDEI